MTHAAAQPAAAVLAPSSAKGRMLPLAAMRRVRLLVQVAVLVLLVAPLWWPAVFRAPAIYQGNLAAGRLQLGGLAIPMSDPFTSLCVLLGSFSAPATLLMGAGIILGCYTLVRGRAFCAYACPVHLVLELWDKLLVKTGLCREGIGERGSRGLNVAIAFLLLLASAVVGMPVFEPVNPINALIRSLQHLAFGGLWLVAGVMVLEALAGRRVFCRQLCPVGGFYAAVNRAGVAGVAVDPATCTGCRKCTAFCLAAPELMNAIAQAREQRVVRPVESAHCTLCFECAGACEHQSVIFQNRWRVGRLKPDRCA
jgi:ferredoxin-type protein NapH